MLRIEWVLILLAVLLAIIYPSLGSRWFETLEHHFSRLSRRPLLSVTLVGLTALALRAAFLPLLPIPEPIVHDEFGYLLAADTFAHGRLTNPTHPMWVHFESFSILQKPTYQCFAQPGQGITLALGRVLFGHPFWGVWLSIGVMCAAITWMLRGWLPPDWALLGGILALLRYSLFSYWANSYWGGALSAIGGALVLGALPRIKASLRVRDALMIGLGLALLANARPYEGVVFSLPVAAALFAWSLRKERPPFRLTLRRVIVPTAIVLVITGTWLAYYFRRVTGSPFQLPYQIERITYGIVPYFLWQHIRPEPVYHNAILKKMYAEQDLAHYKLFRSPTGYLAYGFVGWSFFLGPALTLPFLMLFFSLPRDLSLRDIRGPTAFLLFEASVFLLGSLLVNYYSPHYSAPATGLMLALVLLAARQMRDWSPTGRFLTRAIPIICVLTLTIRAAAAPLGIRLHEFYEFASHEKMVKSFGREKIKNELEHMPGKHLVIVHYSQTHDTFNEFVYNDAGIDHSKIVWAREIGPREDQELTEYFRDRKIWLLEADENPPRIEPRPASSETTATVQGNR
jgi:hypothetical protein